MKINDLVNKVAEFRFEFDGEVLEGKYYKYKTSTPNYGKGLLASIPQPLEEGTDEEKAARQQEIDEASLGIGLQSITDMIVEWNAQDDEGNPLPLSMELLEQLPTAFTEKLIEFFKELREGNPTNGNGLPAG